MNTIFDGNFVGNYEGPLYAPHPDLIKIDYNKEDEKEIIYDDYSDPFGGH